MEWVVQTKDGKIPLDRYQLLEMLVDAFMTKGDKADHEVLVTAFAEFLRDKNAILETQPLQLMLMSFNVGYYYRVFLEKNKVEKEEKNEEPITTNGSTPTSQTSSDSSSS